MFSVYMPSGLLALDRVNVCLQLAVCSVGGLVASYSSYSVTSVQVNEPVPSSGVTTSRVTRALIVTL
jgi:hypothetical protein